MDFQNCWCSRASVAELVLGAAPAQPVLLVDHQANQLVEAADAGVTYSFPAILTEDKMFPISLLTRRQFETDFGLWKYGQFTTVVSSGYGTWGPRLLLALIQSFYWQHSSLMHKSSGDPSALAKYFKDSMPIMQAAETESNSRMVIFSRTRHPAKLPTQRSKS